MSSDSRRFLLRRRTHPNHEQLDHLIGPLDSLIAYRRYLRGVGAFRLAAEAAVQRNIWPDFLSDWRPTLVASFILSDMEDLHETPPLVPSIEAVGSSSALMGLLYVMEGASLGAKMLAVQAETFGLTCDFGARHLNAQISSPQNWRLFLNHLESMPEFDIEEATSSATMMFDHAVASVARLDNARESRFG
ncbi:biliverdin-producing heme oxygenase [Kozakia baliensis]|uniref:biliverdin-producing heme oxygenase n=1 Tax=Kozakia baliensis TaxID=153496 RepID=UPI00345C1990